MESSQIICMFINVPCVDILLKRIILPINALTADAGSLSIKKETVAERKNAAVETAPHAGVPVHVTSKRKHGYSGY